MGKLKSIPANSNGILLRFVPLLCVIVAVLILVWGILPAWHNHSLKIELSSHFRYGYAYRDDYLLYAKTVEEQCKKYDELFLGDSVIWGMYVNNSSTLPAFLNEKIGKERFGNIAIDGLHPVAMERLIENYGKAIQGKKVYLYLNPLWMNTPLYDLSGDGTMTINHPRLIPQFDRTITCYHGTLKERCNAVLEHTLDYYALLHHLRVCFLGNKDFKSYIAKHPGENPLAKIKMSLNPIETGHTLNSKISWEEGGIPQQNWPWVALDRSRQWKAFNNTLALLQERGNEVVVLIGSINPFMQSPESLQKCEGLRQDAQKRLIRTAAVQTIMLPQLPSAEYGDASHPLAPGYQRLANYLLPIL